MEKLPNFGSFSIFFNQNQYKMLEQINPQVLQELHSNRLFLDHLLVLERIKEGQRIPKEIRVLLQPLSRKLLIIEMNAGKEDYMITEGGKRLLETIYSLQDEQVIEDIKPQGKVLKEQINSKFEEWWQAYPSTNSFEYKGKVFEGIQKKNQKKEECRISFNKIVASGQFTADEIILGTKNHIELAKRESYRTGKNQLTYISGAVIYLREKLFSDFIKKVIKEDKSSTNTVDI